MNLYAKNLLLTPPCKKTKNKQNGTSLKLRIEFEKALTMLSTQCYESESLVLKLVRYIGTHQGT